jgi:putative molybdopterin biosynthesis protein
MTNGTSLEWLTVNPADQTPIHRQVSEQITLAIARGKLSADQRLPTVRALARRLGVHTNTVARAYTALAQGGIVSARPGRGTFVARPPADSRLMAEREVRLDSIMVKALVEAVSLGFSPEQVEASFTLRLARFRQEVSAAETGRVSRAQPSRGLVVMGNHDLALDLLLTYLRRLSGVQVTSTHTGSLGGLISVARGEAQVAGCHLLDEESGEYNVPFVRRVLAGVPSVVVTLVERMQGLLVPRRNPKGIAALEDVERADARLINRERGSGTRVLLDFLLRRLGMDPSRLRGYEVEVDNHMAVAAAVASGQADVGLGILAAARALDLDFIPLKSERYDLVVTREIWDQPPVRTLRKVLESREFRDSVGELGGYDTSQTGVVAARLDG